MHILSLALGGCLRGEPVCYGITEDTGGHITYILGEMRALAKRADVRMAEIVTRRFDDETLGTIHAQAEEWLNPKLIIRRIDSGNSGYLAKDNLARDRSAFTKALIEELRSRETLPDIIHAHFADAGDIAIAIERELGIPFIYTAHSLGLDKLETGVSNPALSARIAEEDAAIRHASAVVGSSRDECERQIGAYPSARLDRIHVLKPGVEPADTNSASLGAARDLIAPFLREADRPIILAIARPVHKKNLVALVEAFGSNPNLRQSCNLVILAGQRSGLDEGETEHREVLNALLRAIDRHDLYGHVAYPKRHAAAEVSGLYGLAAQTRGVFVNPALVEPFGLTICEAAAHGLPVVATNRGGPVDSVRQLDHGILVEATDIAALSKAIESVVSNRGKWTRMSDNGRRNVQAMSWDLYADGIVALTRTILDPAVRKDQGPATSLATSLVVSDLDHTLTGCVAGARRVSAFFERRGDFAFVAATGRSIIEAQRIVREWALPTPRAWITSTGSEIYWQTPRGLQRDLAYHDAISGEWAGDAVTRALADIDGLTPQPIYEQRQAKRSYFYRDDAVLTHAHEALHKAGLKVQLIASHGDLLDILPINAGKGPAMNHVAHVLGIARDRVVAIGDSGNDVDMLVACENAVMVGNHAPELTALSQRSNVYVSRRHHALGALEGIFAHRARRKRRASGKESA